MGAAAFAAAPAALRVPAHALGGVCGSIKVIKAFRRFAAANAPAQSSEK